MKHAWVSVAEVSGRTTTHVTGIVGATVCHLGVCQLLGVTAPKNHWLAGITGHPLQAGERFGDVAHVNHRN